MSQPCEQKENIEHIKVDLLNHKTWRVDTSTRLEDISVQLATINERLKQRLEGFDQHVREGAVFRANIANTTLGLVLTLVIAICSAVFIYGGIAKQVEINTMRWNAVMAGEQVK